RAHAAGGEVFAELRLVFFGHTGDLLALEGNEHLFTREGEPLHQVAEASHILVAEVYLPHAGNGFQLQAPGLLEGDGAALKRNDGLRRIDYRLQHAVEV